MNPEIYKTVFAPPYKSTDLIIHTFITNYKIIIFLDLLLHYINVQL